MDKVIAYISLGLIAFWGLVGIITHLTGFITHTPIELILLSLSLLILGWYAYLIASEDKP